MISHRMVRWAVLAVRFLCVCRDGGRGGRKGWRARAGVAHAHNIASARAARKHIARAGVTCLLLLLSAANFFPYYIIYRRAAYAPLFHARARRSCALRARKQRLPARPLPPARAFPHNARRCASLSTPACVARLHSARFCAFAFCSLPATTHCHRHAPHARLRATPLPRTRALCRALAPSPAINFNP